MTMAHCGATLSLQLCLSNLLEDNCQQPGGRLCLLVSRRGEVNHFHDPPKTQVCSSKRLKNKSMIWDLLSVKGDTCYSVAGRQNDMLSIPLWKFYIAVNIFLFLTAISLAWV